LISVIAASPSPRNFLQKFFRSVHRFGKRAEPRQDRFGERLGVATRNGAKQHKLDQFVIGKRVGASVAKALPKTLAMAEIMWIARILEAHAASTHLVWRGGRSKPSGEAVKI
jgi:hypothetical protein